MTQLESVSLTPMRGSTQRVNEPSAGSSGSTVGIGAVVVGGAGVLSEPPHAAFTQRHPKSVATARERSVVMGGDCIPHHEDGQGYDWDRVLDSVPRNPQPERRCGGRQETT